METKRLKRICEISGFLILPFFLIISLSSRPVESWDYEECVNNYIPCPEIPECPSGCTCEVQTYPDYPSVPGCKLTQYLSPDCVNDEPYDCWKVYVVCSTYSYIHDGVAVGCIGVGST